MTPYEIAKIWELSDYVTAPRMTFKNIKDQKRKELAVLLLDIAEKHNISKAALPISLISAARKYDHWDVS